VIGDHFYGIPPRYQETMAAKVMYLRAVFADQWGRSPHHLHVGDDDYTRIIKECVPPGGKMFEGVLESFAGLRVVYHGQKDWRMEVTF